MTDMDALMAAADARGPERIAHPYNGPDLPTEVFADPGRHGWYFREKMPDSVARFVRADLAPDPQDAVEAMVEALREITICVEDGCYCSEMKMAAAVDEARAALAAFDVSIVSGDNTST